MSDSSKLRPLFAAYANGGISSAQLQELEAALREDAVLRREFIEYLNLDSALGDLAALSETEAAQFADESNTIAEINNLHPFAGRVGGEERTAGEGRPGGDVCKLSSTAGPLLANDRPSRGQRERRSRRLPVGLTAIAGTVAASLLVAAILWVAGPNAENDGPMVTVVSEVDAALMRDDRLWTQAKLPIGEYRLNQGLLNLQFAGGVMVYVEAPARFDVVSQHRLELLSGRVSANVPREGIGFTIETPEATIVDYGTEFSVEAGSGASEVHVFNGQVRVRSRRDTDDQASAIDLRASEAIRIENSPRSLVPITLAADRFIRSFDEPQRNYARSVKQLSPVAYYRMPIRDRGLVSVPSQYSGEVLTGTGVRPPHAHGVFAGGALRVGADSTGRGGRVDIPPSLNTGRFSLAVFVYLATPSPRGTVATNIQGDAGSYALSLDAGGRLQATLRDGSGQLQHVTSHAELPLKTWRHVVMTVDDGTQLRLYEDGRLTASVPCDAMATSKPGSMWLGTTADRVGLWNGRIDELALFDKALTDDDIAALYQTAQDERARAE